MHSQVFCCRPLVQMHSVKGASYLESTKIRMSTESAMKPREPALSRNGMEWLRGPAHQYSAAPSSVNPSIK